MQTRYISTEHDTVELNPMPDEVLDEINRYWPMPVLRTSHEGNVVYALGFQRGEQHLRGLKLQQVEVPEEDAVTWLQLNSARVAYAAPGYQEAGMNGVLVTASYMRPKGEDLVEPGIALFAAPDRDGPEQQPEAPLAHIDEELGRGFSTMAVTLVDNWRSAAKDKLPPLVPIGMDIRSRPQLGKSRMDLMFVGEHVICLRTMVEQEDPFWGFCADAGLTQMLHMPSVPAALPDGAG